MHHLPKVQTIGPACFHEPFLNDINWQCANRHQCRAHGVRDVVHVRHDFTFTY